jgi:hypothetical protein
MGDFNIDLLKYNLHEKTKDYIDNIFSRGFVPLISKPTRVTTSSASLIDHMYTNSIPKTTMTGIIINDVADHFGIYHIEKKTPTHKRQIIRQKRNFSEANLEIFKGSLNETDFTPIFQLDCPNEAYNKFIELYNTSFNNSFPLKRFIPNKKYNKIEPWMSAGLLTSLRNKSKLLKKKLRHPTDKNIKIYKTYINCYNKVKKQMKKNYLQYSLEVNKHNMKNTWDILRKVIGKQNNKSNFPQTFLIDNKTVSDQSKIAEGFNNYFSKIGKSTSQNVPNSHTHYTDYLGNPVMNSIFIEPVEPSNLIDIVNKMKPKTSSGHDEISTKMIKQTINHIILPLTHIINKSLTTGIVPKQLKIAKVIPVYKSSNHDQLKNYRPISLLPAFSKIFEKVMFNKIMSYLNSKQIFYEHQYGFRSKHSTIHPILHLLNTCAEVNNRQPKKLTMSIFCDLSKAFDVINHDILMHKLEFYGIRGIAKTWLSNYLTERKQYVEIENNKSNMCSIECGVPQGSILGPLLYLIYVNDISKSTTENILSFADDTSLFISDSNIDNLFQRANTEINNLFNWFCANRLSLNPSKTKYIIIKSPKHQCSTAGLHVMINNTTLSQVGKEYDEQSTKFLGVHIDECLSWKYHLQHVNKKISRSLWIMKQVKNILPADSMRTLYFTLIHPHITYGILAWGNASKSVLNRTIILQKRAVRLINRATYNSHTEPLFKHVKILKLNDQYEYEVALFMYDYVTNKLPISFHNVYRNNHEIQTTHQTRQANFIHIIQCNSTFSQKLPLYEFPHIWNKWTNKIPQNTSRSIYKKNLKHIFLSNYNN